MKKISLAIFLFSLMLFSCPTIAREQYIEVQQADYIEVEPNIVEINITVENTNKDVKVATKVNKDKSNEVYKAVAKFLNDGEYLKTSLYNVTPVYFTAEDNKGLSHYKVTNTITLRTENIEKISDIIDTAIASGATKISKLQFSNSNIEMQTNELLAILTKRAYIKAQDVALAANSKVTGIRYIHTNINTNNIDSGRFVSASNNSDTLKAMSTPIAIGKIKIKGSINATFFVTKKLF